MFDRILVPTDGTESAERAVEWAMELAAENDAEVVGLYVNNVSDIVPAATSPSAPDEIESAIEREGVNALDRLERMAPDGVRVTTEMREGNPADEIVTYTQEEPIDTVVMARKSTSLLSNLGSNTNGVVRSSGVPIVVVPVDDD
ncbi:MAG: universal stress protein [Haloferacaceae archaeon]